MRNRKLLKSKKIAAGALSLLMLAVMLLSAFFIAADADHDCTGEDCPICECIEQCEHLFVHAADGTAERVSALLPVVMILFCAVLFAAAVPQQTLVSGKVRLNN